MSYTNGVSGAQPANTLDTVAATGTAAANRLTQTAAGSRPSQADGDGDGRVGTDAATATLSSTSAVVAQALSGSDVRTEKVAALQQSIAAGTYNVPSAAVADKLIGSMLK